MGFRVSLDRIDEATLSNGIVMNGDMIPHEPDPGTPLQKIGAPTTPWLEGRFVNVFADSVSVLDAGGTSRRVLLEDDSVTVSYNDLDDLPSFTTVATTGSYNDLTDKPPLSGSVGPPDPAGQDGKEGTDGQDGAQGPQGPPGSSEWADITNKPAWVAETQGDVNLSGFNNDLSLTAGDVEWTDVLNKPTFFSGSFNDLTDKPTWVTGTQGDVNLSGFNND
jgi:hypothetical protein